jgi:PAS domain-containing protein
MNDGLVVLDKDWHYVYLNQKAAEMLQRQSPSELISKHIWTEYPEGVGQPFQRAYEKAMREQVPVVFEEHYEPWDLWFENRIYPSPDTLTILFTEITNVNACSARWRNDSISCKRSWIPSRERFTSTVWSNAGILPADPRRSTHALILTLCVSSFTCHVLRDL